MIKVYKKVVGDELFVFDENFLEDFVISNDIHSQSFSELTLNVAKASALTSNAPLSIHSKNFQKTP